MQARKSPSALRVLYLGDSPLATTGFGVVADQLCQGFRDAGMQVTCLGASETRGGTVPCRIVPATDRDPYGIAMVAELVRSTAPDVVFVCHELRLTRTWLALVRKERPDIPVVAYRGIPGDPLPEEWVAALREVSVNVAYTDYAARVIRRDAGVAAEVLHHGVDHKLFVRLPAERRAELRRIAGWGDKFVVLYVGRNRPNKGHPELIEAVALLHERGMVDLLCHLHCTPLELEVFHHPEAGFIFGGWNLKQLARDHGVAHAVLFPAHYRTAARGTPHAGRSAAPSNAAELGLVHLYNAADLYMHPSMAETFGLPLLEAMACGLPVVHRNDGGNMNEICADVGLRLQATRAVDDGYGGRAMVGLSGEVIANGIERARERLVRPGEKEQWACRCLKRASAFPWGPTRSRMSEIVLEAACRNPYP
jgi:glycosyltransferase involved in cell wall biosynthesis